MPRGSSAKRERQYEHIESSARERGASSGRAKEIAARTVNKQRAQSGETSGSGGGRATAGKTKNASTSRSTSTGKSSGSKRSTSSSTSSSGNRGGSRSSSSSARSSGSSSSSNNTFRELYTEAQRRDIKGRSSMDKAQLERALADSGVKRGR